MAVSPAVTKAATSPALSATVEEAVAVSPGTMASAEATSPAPSRTAGHLVSAPGALSAAGVEAAEQAPTAYDLLERFKLPRGILPQGVTGLVLRQDSTFEVQLVKRMDEYACLP